MLFGELQQPTKNTLPSKPSYFVVTSILQTNFWGLTTNVCVICICMNLWGIAVLELDSHPDHNKGPDHAPCACP